MRDFNRYHNYYQNLTFTDYQRTDLPELVLSSLVTGYHRLSEAWGRVDRQYHGQETRISKRRHRLLVQPLAKHKLSLLYPQRVNLSPSFYRWWLFSSGLATGLSPVFFPVPTLSTYPLLTRPYQSKGLRTNNWLYLENLNLPGSVTSSAVSLLKLKMKRPLFRLGFHFKKDLLSLSYFNFNGQLTSRPVSYPTRFSVSSSTHFLTNYLSRPRRKVPRLTLSRLGRTDQRLAVRGLPLGTLLGVSSCLGDRPLAYSIPDAEKSRRVTTRLRSRYYTALLQTLFLLHQNKAYLVKLSQWRNQWKEKSNLRFKRTPFRFHSSPIRLSPGRSFQLVRYQPKSSVKPAVSPTTLSLFFCRWEKKSKIKYVKKGHFKLNRKKRTRRMTRRRGLFKLPWTPTNSSLVYLGKWPVLSRGRSEQNLFLPPSKRKYSTKFSRLVTRLTVGVFYRSRPYKRPGWLNYCFHVTKKYGQLNFKNKLQLTTRLSTLNLNFYRRVAVHSYSTLRPSIRGLTRPHRPSKPQPVYPVTFKKLVRVTYRRRRTPAGRKKQQRTLRNRHLYFSRVNRTYLRASRSAYQLKKDHWSTCALTKPSKPQPFTLRLSKWASTRVNQLPVFRTRGQRRLRLRRFNYGSPSPLINRLINRLIKKGNKQPADRLVRRAAVSVMAFYHRYHTSIGIFTRKRGGTNLKLPYVIRSRKSQSYLRNWFHQTVARTNEVTWTARVVTTVERPAGLEKLLQTHLTTSLLNRALL